jgi:hypothetical protein
LKIKKNKILIIGKSNKFIKFVKKNFYYNFLKIISWRKIIFQINNLKKNDYDLILICGFDFSSFNNDFADFYRKNISDPLDIVLKNTNLNTDVLYINTLKDKSNITYSRYKFAKQRLANLLAKKIKNIYVYHCPLILVNKSVDLNKGWFTGIILPFFIWLNIIPSINFEKMSFVLKNYHLNLKKKKLYPQIYGKNLYIKRNQFLDRMLRVLLK